MRRLLRSPTSGTYPPWLTWGTSCPVRSLQSLRKAGGLCPCQRLAHRTFGTVVLLPARPIYRGTPKHSSFVSVHQVPALGTSLAVSWYPREQLYYISLLYHTLASLAGYIPLGSTSFRVKRRARFIAATADLSARSPKSPARIEIPPDG